MNIETATTQRGVYGIFACMVLTTILMIGCLIVTLCIMTDMLGRNASSTSLSILYSSAVVIFGMMSTLFVSLSVKTFKAAQRKIAKYAP